MSVVGATEVSGEVSEEAKIASVSILPALGDGALMKRGHRGVQCWLESRFSQLSTHSLPRAIWPERSPRCV